MKIKFKNHDSLFEVEENITEAKIMKIKKLFKIPWDTPYEKININTEDVTDFTNSNFNDDSDRLGSSDPIKSTSVRNPSKPRKAKPKTF